MSDNHEDIIRCLNKIDNKYSLFSFKSAENVDEHIDCLLKIFQEEFKAIKDHNAFPIKAVLPLFYQLDEWGSWKTKEIKYYTYLSSLGTLKERLVFQSKLSEESKISFSKSILRLQNEAEARVPIQTYIRIDVSKEIEQQKFLPPYLCFPIVDKPQLYFTRYAHSCILDIHSTKKEIELTNPFSETTFNITRDEDIETLSGAEEKTNSNSEINFKIRKYVENETLNEFYNAAKMHTLYLEKDLTLLYVFSDSVGEYNKEWENIKKRGIGGMFLIVQKKILDNKQFETEFVKIIKQITDKVANRIIQFYQLKIIEQNATRAAISQVMTRNMSHNIGSHVLSNMVTEISVETHFPKVQYKSLYDNSLYSDLSKTINKNEWKLANFNSYLRTRMDFLADIATGQPAMEVTRSLVRDVLGEMDKNRILLNHISGVDNFEYSIVVKDCRECKLVHCSNHECGCDGKEKDIPVSIPNGIMGYHALYILIENVIRNTAKHQGSTSTLENRIFTLEIRDSKIDNTLFEVLLYDNVPIGGDFIVDKDFFKKYTEKEYIPEENKFLTRLDWLVFQQNCRLNSSVINPSTSRLRDGAWGLIEMDAASAYLRKFSPESIDENIYNLDVFNEEKEVEKEHLNILKAVKKGDHLAYRFHLMKPKELLVVDETKTGILYNRLRSREKVGKTKHDQLLENGIWVMQTTNPNADNFFDINSVYAHPFMLIIAGDKFNINNYLYTKFTNDDDNGLFRGNLPTRIIVCSDEIKQDNKEETPWITYIGSTHRLMIALQKAKDLPKIIPNSIDDLKNQTLMDIVWQVWLKHKIDYYSIQKTNTNIINNYILPANTSNSLEFKIKLAWHATQSDVANRKNDDHFLAYPSSVKSFMDNATLDKESLTEPNKLFDKIGLAILTDSFLTKILVIDERVQMAWEQYYSLVPDKEYPNIKLKQQELFEYGELFSPIKLEIDLSEQSYFVENGSKTYEKLIEDYIDRISTKGNLKGLDYIVIHLGVIEKILTANKSPKKKDNVKDFIHGLQNKLSSKTRIVITSGRGKPDNLPEEVPFVSFSTLSQYTVETPFKPFLNQILQNARTFKN